MDKVKNLMAAGAPLADAVRIALGDRSIPTIAIERNLNRSTLSNALSGGRAPTVEEIEAMVSELGGTFDEWREAFANAAAARVRSVVPAAANS